MLWSEPEKDVVATVTDGACVMVKFGKDTSPQHVTCYVHVAHFAVCEVLCKTSNSMYYSTEASTDVNDFGNDPETVAEDDSEEAEVATFLSPSLQDVMRKV